MEGTGQEKLALQWHPAFYADIRVEFGKDADLLIFENEHQLGTKPKEIDVLIIKKDSDAVLTTNLGRIFRRHNIVEYKSPQESLGIGDYYRAYGYIGFYLAELAEIEEMKAPDVTLSFVCFHHPHKVMRYLQECRGLTITKEEDGIYYVHGEFVPVQIIVTQELSKEKNFWLRNLTNELKNSQEALEILYRYAENQDNELYRSVLDIIVKANVGRFGEDKMLYDTLEELLAERIRKKVEQGEARGEARGEVRGEARGEARGTAKGENLFARLTASLLKDSRMEDLQKATEDVDYRRLLYREYGLSVVVAEDEAEYIVNDSNRKLG